MTKQEELKVWQDFAESLPIESYSKGAMQSLLIELENALRSDSSPTLSLFDASQQALSWIEGAKNTAEGILKHSKEQAQRITAEAKDEEKRFWERVYTWKRKALREVESLWKSFQSSITGSLPSFVWIITQGNGPEDIAFYHGLRLKTSLNLYVQSLGNPKHINFWSKITRNPFNPYRSN